MRKFIPTTDQNQDLIPTRSTKKAAAYDLRAAVDGAIFPGETKLIKTGMTVQLPDDEWLEIKGRSGLAIKKGIIVGAGVIDADYFPGEIGVIVHNFGEDRWIVERGERVAQAIFHKYLITDDDEAEGERQGGFGSTGLK